MANSPTGESVLQRVDRVLAAFTAEDPRLTGARIAARTGLPPATAHRLAGDMVRQGWLERVAGGEYVVGTRLWELANRSSRELTLAQAARPFMGDIHSVLRQHVQLGIIEGREVLLVERLSHPDAVPVRASVAGRLPLHLSATGLVLLAHASGEFREAYLEGPIPAVTEHSPAGPEALAAELERIRLAGHAMQTGYLEPDTAGVAVPVRGRGEHVLAGLGVVVRAGDPAARTGAVVQALHTAAHGVRRTLREAAAR